MIQASSQSLLHRMAHAVDQVHDRLRRATDALDGAAVPYAIVGGHAVAAWVATRDEDAVRNTNDVDVLLRRDDLPAAQAALEQAGFVRRDAMGIIGFLDGPEGKFRSGVHVVLAGELIRPEYPLPAADVSDAERPGNICVLKLEPLVMMKLTSFRDKDRTHLRDLLDVGLIDREWLDRVPEVLRDRLQLLLDTPDG